MWMWIFILAAMLFSSRGFADSKLACARLFTNGEWHYFEIPSSHASLSLRIVSKHRQIQGELRFVPGEGGELTARIIEGNWDSKEITLEAEDEAGTAIRLIIQFESKIRKRDRRDSVPLGLATWIRLERFDRWGGFGRRLLLSIPRRALLGGQVP